MIGETSACGGLISRTGEMSNADPTNNRNHYYLPDVMGGNIGLYVDDDGDPAPCLSRRL